MANATILGGNVTVYFRNDPAGDKQIKWTGSTAITATHTVNELYSGLMDLFDNVTAGAGDYMNEGVPMKAVTPRAYQLGRIETNDPEPWYIDQTTIEHLTGGSIETLGWTRTPGSTIGIVRVPATTINILSSDVGSTITHADGDSGKLLYVGTDFLTVRPDDATAANNFDSTTGTLTCNGRTATQTAASTTGNNFWTNLFTVGQIETGSNIYVAQDQTVLTSYWSSGHIDRLIKVEDQSTTFIDNGYLYVYSRKPDTLYSSFLTRVEGSGRVTVPITNSVDLNDLAATVTGITINIAGPYSADIDPDIVGNESYSIQINCGGQPLQNVYTYLKQVTAEGSTTLFAGVEGQQYTGIDYRLDYATETGTVSIGDEITGSVSGATGYVVNKNTNYVMLTNSQGTFVNGENLTIGANSLNTTSNAEPITAKITSPFGTYAGGRFFGARGVYLTNLGAGENNNYETFDDDGNLIAEELQVSYTITNILANTEIRIYTYTDIDDPTTYTEIAGVEDIGGPADPGDSNLNIGGSDPYTATYTYVYSADTGIVIIAFNTGYLAIRRTDSLTATDQSIQINQVFDRQYT